MKMIVAVTLALVAVVSAAPVEENPIVLRSNSEQYPDGSFDNGFETSDGTKIENKGELKQVTNEDNKPVLVVVQRGSYEYLGEGGKPINVEWVADELGFRAQGDSIPKAPSRR